MAEIKISALGELRKYVPKEKIVAMENGRTTIFDFLEAEFAIPRTEARMSFVVNGGIKKGDYQLKDKDSMVILKMGGAG